MVTPTQSTYPDPPEGCQDRNGSNRYIVLAVPYSHDYRVSEPYRYCTLVPMR
jgi:hypothetical protein